MEKDIKSYSTQEILKELLKREEKDSTFELIKETPTSYTFKFFRFD